MERHVALLVLGFCSTGLTGCFTSTSELAPVPKGVTMPGGSCAVFCLKGLGPEIEPQPYSCKEGIVEGACSHAQFASLPGARTQCDGSPHRVLRSTGERRGCPCEQPSKLTETCAGGVQGGIRDTRTWQGPCTNREGWAELELRLAASLPRGVLPNHSGRTQQHGSIST
eukprot:CAMPEP_0171094036 /NCGR_PEP_ID=MMETSP0766_2-20121228/39671_1 /TAXON_ID=439317 /ORGANISM="Gambierdiscus australes, Strain CAWD 149" /LENGTH=168 /DNA_ID=CAMNT_0011552579 /DNA_START=68 /DNA_END=571 /DNA_ORIENTATION=+